MLSSIASQVLRRSAAKNCFRSLATTSAFPPPRLFDYETVTSNLTVGDAISSVEEAFAALAQGNVDVPMPMHIGISESSVAGPGDCHIKGGYIDATPTFTVSIRVNRNHVLLLLLLHEIKCILYIAKYN